MIPTNQNGAHVIRNLDGVVYTLHVCDGLKHEHKNDFFIMARWRGRHWVSEPIRDKHVSSIHHLRSRDEFSQWFGEFMSQVDTARKRIAESTGIF